MSEAGLLRLSCEASHAHASLWLCWHVRRLTSCCFELAHVLGLLPVVSGVCLVSSVLVFVTAPGLRLLRAKELSCDGGVVVSLGSRVVSLSADTGSRVGRSLENAV